MKMTLIELIRICIDRGFQYLTIDYDGQAFGSTEQPYVDYMEPQYKRWLTHSTMYDVGEYELTCDWANAIIDISQLRGVS